MRGRLLAGLVLVLSALWLLTGLVLADHVPRPSGFVNDFAHVLNAAQREDLEQRLQRLENDTGHEVAIVTVEDMDGETIETYGIKLAEEWGVGKDEQDNGVIILVAVQEKQVRIEVGYGLEGIITDAESGRIIRNVMVPQLRENDYYTAFAGSISEIDTRLRDDEADEQRLRSTPRSDANLINTLGLFFTVGFLPVIYIGSFMARSRSIWAGGILGGIVGFILANVQTVVSGLLIVPGLVGLGLLLDYMLSSNYHRLQQRHRATDWWSSGGGFGGFGGGSGGGGGGFGGFGGGGFGGGGASGDW